MLTHTIDDSARLVIVSGSHAAPLDAAADSLRCLCEMGERVHGYGLLILVHQAVPTPAEGDLRLLSEMVHLAGNTVRGAVAIVTRGVGHATPAALIAMAGDGKDAVRAFFDEDDARRWLATFRTP